MSPLNQKSGQPPEGVGFGNCNVCVYDYNQGQLELLQVIDPISGLEVTL